MEFFFVLAAIFSFIVTVLWLVIGWRAMLAHEAIAKAVSRYVAKEEVDRSASIRAEKISNTKLYKEFIDEDSNRANLPARERHEAFRVWSEKNHPGASEE